MPNLFFTADLHFGHASIIRHTDRPQLRPGDLDEHGGWVSLDRANERLEEMDAFLVKKWNSVVNKHDHVVIVGDFAWKDHAKYFHRLCGKKTLIKGNHDKMSGSVLALFENVYDLHKIHISEEYSAVCCHYCMQRWPSSHHGVWHFYGHSHGRMEEVPGVLRCDVGVDVWDYAPVPAEVLIQKMRKMAEIAPLWFPDQARYNTIINRQANQQYKEQSCEKTT
jgi:calcineurin-like phosphoesterase family protein